MTHASAEESLWPNICWLNMRRKMYDCIVMATGTLPPGVELIEVLEDAAEAEVAEIMASMPRNGDKLSAQDIVAAGVSCSSG